jgi:hypothetical protein
MKGGAKLIREAIYEIAVRGRLDQRWADAATLEDGQLVARRVDVPEAPGT